LFGIAAIDVYFDPLNVTAAPFAYAVQLANAGRPEQLTCAEAVLARARPRDARATMIRETRRRFIASPPHRLGCLEPLGKFPTT
jgi:hypothetical protein